jgi:hypothetical protein
MKEEVPGAQQERPCWAAWDAQSPLARAAKHQSFRGFPQSRSHVPVGLKRLRAVLPSSRKLWGEAPFLVFSGV